MTRAMVAPGERDRNLVGKMDMDTGEKSSVDIQDARTANRHR